MTTKKVALVISRMCLLIIVLATATVHATVHLAGTVTGRAQQDSIHIQLDALPPNSTNIYAAAIVEGAFTIELPCASPMLASIQYKGQKVSLFLEPNEQLTCSFQADDLSATFEWIGEHAASKRLISDFYNRFEKQVADSILLMAQKAKGIDEYEYLYFSSRKIKREYCAKHPDNLALTNAARQFLTAQIDASYKLALMNFVFDRNATPVAKGIIPLPSIMTEAWDRMVFDDSSALIAPDFRLFIRKYIYYKALQENGNLFFSDASLSMTRQNSFAQRVLMGSVYTWWLSDLLHEQCAEARPETVKLMLKILADLDPAKRYWGYANEKCGLIAKQKEQVIKKEKKPSEPEPVAESNDGMLLLDLKGKAVHLTDFKGKVVYVDCWASWCGPCRGQFPYSKKLHEKFSAADLKKIVFLYISIDESEDAWRKAVNQNELQGIQLRSPGGWNSTLCKTIGIQSIPRYLILDKKGKIVESDAPRPSDDSVYDELIKLMRDN